MIVSREAKERTDCLDRLWWRPVEYRLHLLAVHGHADDGNHMPETGIVCLTGHALGALEEVFLQFGEY
jgi:hypothetical protein